MSGATIVVEELTTRVVEVEEAGETIVVVEVATQLVEVETAEAGPQGPQGPVGPQGPAGPASAFYEHVQASASATWTINHNLGFRPTVSAIDEGSQQIEGAVVHTSINQLVLSFATPIAGRARCT